MNARDIAIRTILGEAAGEDRMGQAAVAHVLLNRARDPRWPSTVQEVALQNKQFSAWNSGAGGNHLVNKYKPGDSAYDRVGAIYDQVASGQIADPTGGATHYYSPAGMQKLVSDGSQSNILPRWLQQQNELRGAAPTTIGGHIFTGRAEGSQVPMGFGQLGPAPSQPQGQHMSYGAMAPVPTGNPFFDLPTEEPDPQMGLAQALMAMDQQPKVPQILQAPMPQQYQPQRRDTTAPYLEFFKSMRG